MDLIVNAVVFVAGVALQTFYPAIGAKVLSGAQFIGNRVLSFFQKKPE